MPIRLKTSPHLNYAAQFATKITAFAAATLLVTIALIWGVNYAKSYMEAPVVFNLISTTKQNMRQTLQYLTVALPVAALCLMPALVNVLRHVKSARTLNYKSSRKFTADLTASQVAEIDKLAELILARAFATGSTTIDKTIRQNIWVNIKPRVLSDIRAAAGTHKIDLEVIIKRAIADALGRH